MEYHIFVKRLCRLEIGLFEQERRPALTRPRSAKADRRPKKGLPDGIEIGPIVLTINRQGGASRWSRPETAQET